MQIKDNNKKLFVKTLIFIFAFMSLQQFSQSLVAGLLTVSDEPDQACHHMEKDQSQATMAEEGAHMTATSHRDKCMGYCDCKACDGSCSLGSSVIIYGAKPAQTEKYTLLYSPFFGQSLSGIVSSPHKKPPRITA